MPNDPTDPRPDEIDTGEPIAELADFDAEASQGFLERVGRRIERRQAGSLLLGFWWHGTVAVFLEFVNFAFGVFAPDGSDKGGSA